MKMVQSLVHLGLLILLAAALRAQPNVIIIITDDQGYGDVGFNGCRDIPTPNIDRLAQNGVIFSQGYVTYAVCGPSRAGLITGRYQDRFGFGRNPILAPEDSTMGLPLTEHTLANVLGRVGYRSMAVGKWHLGAHPSLHPLRRGFDEFYGFLSGGHQYFPQDWVLNDLSEIQAQFDGYRTKLLRNYERVEETQYLTDALSREAAAFIGRNPDRPFFLYLAYNAPHAPLQATEEYLQRFAHIEDKRRRTYAAMVSAVDDGVGLLLDQLQTLGIEENTMVFFLSDNGGPENSNASDNGPLRGQKGDLWEGGIRVPFAVQWKGQLPAGMRYDRPVISLDIFATAVAQAQAPLAADKPIDGVDLLPFLRGDVATAPHPFLYWRKFDQQSAALIDQNGMKWLVEQEKAAPQLFNLSRDTAENHSLHDAQPRQLEALQQQWHLWQQELQPPRFMGLMQRQAYYRLRGLERPGE